MVAMDLALVKLCLLVSGNFESLKSQEPFAFSHFITAGVVYAESIAAIESTAGDQ